MMRNWSQEAWESSKKSVLPSRSAKEVIPRGPRGRAGESPLRIFRNAGNLILIRTGKDGDLCELAETEAGEVVLEDGFIVGDGDEGEVEHVGRVFERGDVLGTHTSEGGGTGGRASDFSCQCGPVSGGVTEYAVKGHFNRAGLGDGAGDDGVRSLEEGVGVDCCAASGFSKELDWKSEATGRRGG